ncbi:MAG: hypothetical protein ACN6NV_13545, partial [Acinetobacter gandensis]|uniref:hypothetical protein n=1 Tax=Acinetobacter gandensis TaxID=1443941 RepID=UPI003CFF460E
HLPKLPLKFESLRGFLCVKSLCNKAVKINQDFVELDNWDVTNIRDRGLRLANLFADLFN